MESSKLSSSTSSSSEHVQATSAAMRPKIENEETTTITTSMSEGGGITTGSSSSSSGQRRDRQLERQPLVPVQSSKKRKRDRPSLDGEETDTRNDIENKKPRVISVSDDYDSNEVVPSSSDEEADTVLPINSPPSIDSVLSPWDVREEDPTLQPPPPKHEQHSTPHANRRASNLTNKKVLRGANVPCYVSPSAEQRPCPLPDLCWADPKGVWKAMCRRDGRNLLDRHPNMLDKHPGILQKMRAILLDWLIEVCEVYKLHRETYHLAMDYLDRYLSRTRATCKTQLQLIGITCLFIAAKMEEIYPPKIAEFAYVTDGACDEADIQMQELGILQVLEWKVNTITAIAWLGIYLQVDVCQRRDIVSVPKMLRPVVLETPDKSPARGGGDCAGGDRGKKDMNGGGSVLSNAFEFPQFSGYEFTQVAQLMDLCSLDVEIANYPYSVVAAAAVHHVKDRKTALAVSGLGWESIADCVLWMESFHTVILEDGAPLQLLEQNEHVVQNHGLRHVCPNLTKDDSYKIQMHTCNLDMFDKVMRRREETAVGSGVQNLLSPEGMLTPPASSRKSLDVASSSAVSETKPT